MHCELLCVALATLGIVAAKRPAPVRICHKVDVQTHSGVGTKSGGTVYVYSETHPSDVFPNGEVKPLELGGGQKSNLVAVLDGANEAWTSACASTTTTTPNPCTMFISAGATCAVTPILKYENGANTQWANGNVAQQTQHPSFSEDVGIVYIDNFFFGGSFDVEGRTFIINSPTTTTATTCGVINAAAVCSAAEEAKVKGIYDSRAFAVPTAPEPCVPWQWLEAFPAWTTPEGSFQMGWPLATANIDSLICPENWWHILWFQQVRYIFWVIFFCITVVIFFIVTCYTMPRMNGRRDTTGFCTKCGNKCMDKLDKKPKVLAWKRKREDNWNGMIAIIFEHFNKSGTGFLSQQEFAAMFSTCGDGFVDSTMYSAACTAFGVGLKGLSIDSIDAMYSLGCRTWREKHVQCGRDLERVKILSDKFPQITHSEFLVVTGSIGPQGMDDFLEKKDLVILGKNKHHHKKAAISKKGRDSVAKDEAEHDAHLKSLDGTFIDVAAHGGDKFACAIDAEFNIENAMSEDERFSVPLPSLYVETWIFVLICAFLFLWAFDLTRWIEATTLTKYYATDCAEENFIDSLGRQNCLDGVPAGFFSDPPLGHSSYLLLFINGKLNVVADVGHKVCLFHFFFIMFFVIPMRLCTVLKPNSSCAKQMKKRLKPKALKEREYRPMHAREIPTISFMVDKKENKPGATTTLKYRLKRGTHELAKASNVHATDHTFTHLIPADSNYGATIKVNVPLGADFKGVPTNCIITASKMSLCQKLQMLPLYFLRDFCGLFVSIFQLFGISLALFVFFAPFIDFQRKSLELSNIRVSGVSFLFSADPIDAYMRWLNLKIVDMLSFGIFEKKFKKKADAMYQGFLDKRITWGIPAADIPKGLDTSRTAEYFTAGVAAWEYLIQKTILLPLICFPCPIWPALFTKHQKTAGWKLYLSKFRFGGRQPRLGGSFIGVGNGQLNTEGATRVFKLNTFTGCLHFGLPCLEARYINVLEENIEWVVPPLPAKCRCTYILCPFPCDGSDETYLAMDEAIPIVVDRPDDFEFPIHKEANPNALSPEEIAFAVNGWVKKDRSGARASAVRYQTGKTKKGKMTKEEAVQLIKKVAEGEGQSWSSQSTMTVKELQEVIETLALITLDVRSSSPVFKRTHSGSTSNFFGGLAATIKPQGSAPNGTATSNPMAEGV